VGSSARGIQGERGADLMRFQIFRTHPAPWTYKNSVATDGAFRVDAIVDRDGQYVATSGILEHGAFQALWEFYNILTPEQRAELGDRPPCEVPNAL
jgi:hypothetical protein